MFSTAFYSLIRVLVVPVVAISSLSATFVGYQMAFLGVAFVLTVMLVPMLIWQGIKIIPNLALIKTKKVMRLGLEIVIEISALIGYWAVYFSIFP